MLVAAKAEEAEVLAVISQLEEAEKMRAEAIRGATVMIGGMPAFDTVLEAVLKESGVHVGYSFTKRQCTETSLDDGGVALLYIFKHEGFIWVS